MNWSTLNTLPIGLVMFAGLVWGYVWRKAGHRLAREQYPALGARLGLAYRAGSSTSQIGQLHGTLRGFAVLVDPDAQCKLIVRFRGEPNIDLRSYESPRRSRRTQYFASQDRGVDTFFKTRYVGCELAERLNAADLAGLLKPFSERYRHQVKELNLTQHGVTCVLDFGNPRYIPVAAVQELLPALLDWAELIEPRDILPS